MSVQLNADIAVAYLRQSVFGTEEASTTGATGLVYKEGSQGFSPVQAQAIQSTSNYGDGMTTRDRRGTFNVPGQFQYEAIAGADGLYPLTFRNEFDAAAELTETNFGGATLTVSGSTITLSGGDLIAAGVSVGDCVRFTTGLDAADLNIWLRIKALTATTITTYEPLTAVASAAAFSFRRPKKLLQSNQSLQATFSQHYEQIGQSYVISDVRGGNLSFALQENGTVDVTQALMGTAGRYADEGQSPHFPDPVFPSGQSLAFLDACFVIDGNETLAVTGFNLDIAMAAETIATANKTGRSPEVVQGKGRPSGQVSMTTEDFAILKAAAAETQLEFMATMVDPETGGLLHLANTNAILMGESVSSIGGDDEMIQTYDIMAGRETRGGAYDRTGFKLLSSAD